MSPTTRRRGSSRSRRPRDAQQRREPRPQTPAEFWGDPAALPPARRDVRITADPAAVPRSLGTPPLPGSETVAEHYFEAVYDRAVHLAAALAAAGGMISPEDLQDDHPA